MQSRRQFMAGFAVGATAMFARPGVIEDIYNPKLGAAASIVPGRTVALDFIAAERRVSLPCFGGQVLPMWTFRRGDWLPIIRMGLGDRLRVTLKNRLPRTGEYTSIHWHGLRVPNDQDGVPYLVQRPVPPGEDFTYEFTPPDTGTYFFHTHCNSVEQLGRGLHGVLIVDGDTTEPYDADAVLFLRDWQINSEEGAFNAFFTPKGASRAGTYGPVRSTNGAVNPIIRVPALGDCRIRLVDADPTRVMQIAIEGTEAAIIAIDGAAVPPFPLSIWTMGPGMRADLVIRAPHEGKVAHLIDRSPPGRVELARFLGDVPVRRSTSFRPAALRAPRFEEPDLRNATRLGIRFEAEDAGKPIKLPDDPLFGSLGSICLSRKIFWSINGQPWPDGDMARLPPPLAVLKRGRSYVFELINETSFHHPIHLHGHTFKLLTASKSARPIHRADTVLLLPEERIEIAFVADNPGDWMFHCHVIEHQETGMMGYFRVT